jgi:hypothetical protein
VDKIFVEDPFSSISFTSGRIFLVGKLADVVAEENFVFGERGQWGGNGADCKVVSGMRIPSSEEWRTVI